MKFEKTLVLIKPDGVKKQLIGEIIKRFENTNLKILGMKMIHPYEELAKKHYPLDEKWCKSAFKKTIEKAKEEDREIPFSDHLEFGKNLQKKLTNFITESPIIAMILQGPNAIKLVRGIVGATEPSKADKGTIRGDLTSKDSYKIAEQENRAVRNLIHASDSLKTAEKEISLWFSDNELYDY